MYLFTGVHQQPSFQPCGPTLPGRRRRRSVAGALKPPHIISSNEMQLQFLFALFYFLCMLYRLMQKSIPLFFPSYSFSIVIYLI